MRSTVDDIDRHQVVADGLISAPAGYSNASARSTHSVSCDYPSEKFIHKLDYELGADEDELLLLADKVPASTLKRIQQPLASIRQIAKLDRSALDRLESSLIAKSKSNLYPVD
ncbi:MAG: hypothetical protein RLZZ396_1549 [Planctomycetota bacterium]